MGIFLNILRSLFIYNKANSYNGFELLETGAEGTDSNNRKKTDSTDSNNSKNTESKNTKAKEKIRVIKSCKSRRVE